LSQVQNFRLFSDGSKFTVRIMLLAGDLALPTAIFFTNYSADLYAPFLFPLLFPRRLTRPLAPRSKFSRTRFEPTRFQKDPEGNGFVEISLVHPGSYDYFLEYSLDAVNKRTRMSHFLMYPQLKLNDYVLPFDGVCMQTVIPKWLGPVGGWDKHFRLAADAGYNAVHFAPLQKPGLSSSPYSLYDQLSFSDEIFGANVPDPQKLEVMRGYATRLQKEFGLLSLTDMVWNHTACNTPWLSEHPEAGYNLLNTPHLKPAFVLDQGIQDFSARIVEFCGSAEVSNEDDLGRVMHTFQEKLLPGLKLWEFFSIPVEKNVALFKEFLQQGQGERTPSKPEGSSFSEEMALLAEKGVSFEPGLEHDRLGKRVDLGMAFDFFFDTIGRNDEAKSERPWGRRPRGGGGWGGGG